MVSYGERAGRRVAGRRVFRSFHRASWRIEPRVCASAATGAQAGRDAITPPSSAPVWLGHAEKNPGWPRWCQSTAEFSLRPGYGVAYAKIGLDPAWALSQGHWLDSRRLARQIGDAERPGDLEPMRELGHPADSPGAPGQAQRPLGEFKVVGNSWSPGVFNSGDLLFVLFI